MHTFTALYDDRADAEAVQDQLEQLGIIELDRGLHDQEASAFSDGRGVAPPEEDRHLYREAVRRGGFLLTVNSDDEQAARVRQVIEDSDAVDMDEREREMRTSGYTGAAANAAAAPTPVAPPASAVGEDVIPVVEERLNVGKRQVDRGGVRVRAYTVETPVREAITLREEHVEVARRPIGERVADAEDLFQEHEIELTETTEKAVVGKTARVVEEVSLTKEVGQRTETIQDTVRHTEVEVERLDPQSVPPSRR